MTEQVQVEVLSDKELTEVRGGVAPLVIAGGIILSTGAGFAGGYTLARFFG